MMWPGLNVMSFHLWGKHATDSQYHTRSNPFGWCDWLFNINWCTRLSDQSWFDSLIQRGSFINSWCSWLFDSFCVNCQVEDKISISLYQIMIMNDSIWEILQFKILKEKYRLQDSIELKGIFCSQSFLSLPKFPFLNNISNILSVCLQ
jgi:hypothetical protein